jgi:exonuclease VII small subunit
MITTTQPSTGSNLAAFAHEVESFTRQLTDVQSLVNTVVADMDAVGAELRRLKPPQPATEKSLRAYAERKRSLEAKLAALNTKLELAYRSIGELEAAIERAKDTLKEAERREAERVAAQLERERDALEQAVRQFAGAHGAETYLNGMGLLAGVTQSVGLHFDGDGEADGELTGAVLELKGPAAKEAMEQFRLSSLEVLPAGEHLDRELVQRLSDASLEVRGTPPPDPFWATTAKLFAQQPASVMYKTADSYGMERGNFVLRVLDIPTADVRLAEIAASFREQCETLGLPRTQAQAADYAWRELAGRTSLDPEKFLADADAPWRAGLPTGVARDRVAAASAAATTPWKGESGAGFETALAAFGAAEKAWTEFQAQHQGDRDFTTTRQPYLAALDRSESALVRAGLDLWTASGKAPSEYQRLVAVVHPGSWLRDNADTIAAAGREWKPDVAQLRTQLTALVSQYNACFPLRGNDPRYATAARLHREIGATGLDLWVAQGGRPSAYGTDGRVFVTFELGRPGFLTPAQMTTPRR